jgi:hypothetical protein
VVLCTRKPTPIHSPAHLDRVYRVVIDWARPDFRGYGLVLDSRAAKGRNDPEWEATLRRLRDELEERFATVIIVVGTATGTLQSRRLSPKPAPDTTRALEEAIALAAQGPAPSG